MEKKRKQPKPVTTQAENKVYLHKIFEMFRDMEYTINAQRHERYNNTEIRLLNEIVYAAANGERLISTQIAARLGITRSAVSQMVAKLEKDGAIRRVADEVDRKIAYIEVTEETMESYQADIKTCSDFIGKVVDNFGEDKFQQMKNLLEEFMDMMDEERQREAAVPPTKKKAK